MTHDLDCGELVDFMHLIIDLFETDVGIRYMSDTVIMLFRVISHFWEYCV